MMKQRWRGWKAGKMQRRRSPFLKSPLPLGHQEKVTQKLERQQIEGKMKTQGIAVSSLLHPPKKKRPTLQASDGEHPFLFPSFTRLRLPRRAR